MLKSIVLPEETSFTLPEPIGLVIHGPERMDGLPDYVEWRGEMYDTPDFEAVEAWVYDSVCETLDGGTVEPDGHDPNGCPSWLLALALV